MRPSAEPGCSSLDLMMFFMKKMHLPLYIQALFAIFSVHVFAADTGPASVATTLAVASADVGEWLRKLHESSRRRAYTGTFVVSTAGTISSARIWHVCDGAQQLERVETLSGTPRAIFRRNDQVVTFFPLSRIAVAEVRESLGLFPSLLQSSDSSIGEYYQLKILGSERIAGFDAEVA